MKIKTSELTGAALDWAVAVALGWKLAPVPPDFDGKNAGFTLVAPDFPAETWSWPRKGNVAINAFVHPYSTDWAQSGLLRDKFMISLFEDVDTGKIEAIITAKGTMLSSFLGSDMLRGPTAQIAICRAVVACKLGDEVEAPDELVQK